MPTRETLISFQQGLKVLESVTDYITLRETLTRLVALVAPEEEALAKDAIARVLRRKQTAEAHRSQGYPQALQELDQKYKDLYLALKTAQGRGVSQAAPAPASAPTPTPTTAPPKSKTAQTNPLTKLSGLNGFSAPMMLLDWIKNKKSTLMMGTALLTTFGGAYYFYNKLSNKDDSKKKKDSEPKEIESNFDRTLKSIQKYHLFSQMTRNPDLVDEFINGGKPKKKKVKKKSGPPKLSEWDYEERALMKNMDSAFNALSVRPKVKYELPQLPESNEIDPNIAKGLTAEDKPRKKKRKGRPRKSEQRAETSSVEESEAPPPKPKAPKTLPSSEEKPKKRRTRRASKSKKSNGDAPGRLIPIIKRTKRISKIKA